MQSIAIGGTSVFLEFALYVTFRGFHIPLVYSVYDRSEMMVRGFLANAVGGIAVCKADNSEIHFHIMPESTNYVSRLSVGMERFCHGIAISQSVGKEYIVTTKEELEEDVYSYLMNHFELPLLREWVPYLLEAGGEYLQIQKAQVMGTDHEDRFQKTYVVYVTMNQEKLAELISDGLKRGGIRIGREKQEKLVFKGLDEYFEKYGHTIVDNLRQKLKPLSTLKECVEEAALLRKRLYPQQCAVTNGIIELLDSSSYGIMNCGCGTGKTIMGCTVVEAYFYRKYLKKHTDKTLKDAYQDPQAVKYRNIVMCPSHLIEKWKREIEDEIPYVKVIIVRGLKELDRLLRKGKERTGKEFYILSKDTGKLSYSLYPQPYQVKHKKVHVHMCKQCKTQVPFLPKRPCSCGCTEWVDTNIEYYETGLVCPECGELLYSLTRKMKFGEEDSRRSLPLMPRDFANETEANKECRWCHAKLWMPACEPMRSIFGVRKKQKQKWVRITHYANKAKRNTKTVWVLEKELKSYLLENELKESEIRYGSIYGPRRYAPAAYIKKKLKGYFDFAIFDELHELKGGGTAQGIAMHSLIKASHKQLGLTGTIAGGYANHVFYLLFRFDPALMRAKGFTYGHAGEMKFSELYGTIEEVYEYDASQEIHNTSSRGRALASPKCRPGISPLIFSEFLMGKAVFLDLADMSRYLPDYSEQVKFIPLEDEIAGEYNAVTTALKNRMKDGEGKGILSSYLQFALSYSDKPYNRRPILSPADGSILAEPEDFSELLTERKLLNKEQYLVDLVNSELADNRNVFVFCEYTGEPDSNVTHRLKEVLETHCVLARNRIVILESGSPPAADREAWMHQKAKAGTRVFITNPKCVETGIDLIFYINGIKYNYPTLIFFQLGYNLFTIWQASRRAFRLIQTEACRTYYLASLNTIQVEVIKMIAEKQVATSAIQGGGFSSEGLSAMANGVDPRIRLASVVAGECQDTEGSIQSMFDVLRHKAEDDTADESYVPMLTFYELVGHEPLSIEDYAESVTIPYPGSRTQLYEDMYSLVFGEFGKEMTDEQVIDLNEGEYREIPAEVPEKIPEEVQETESEQEEIPEPETVVSEEESDGEMSIEDSLLMLLDLGGSTKSSYKKETKSKKKNPINGQMNIMDLFSA